MIPAMANLSCMVKLKPEKMSSVVTLNITRCVDGAGAEVLPEDPDAERLCRELRIHASGELGSDGLHMYTRTFA